jgi:hypothetical protein
MHLSLYAMLAAVFLSIGFLMWVLAGLLREGKRNAVIHVVCGEPVAQRRHTVRFNFDHIVAGTLRRT